MRTQRTVRYALTAAAACLLLFAWRGTARAAEPEDALEKGTHPACSTQLDRSGFDDGSRYQNEAVTVETVKIGLRYGDNAVTYAEFSTGSDTVFSIGHYDDDRRFHETLNTGCDWLEAYIFEGKIHLGGRRFSESYDAAEGVAILPTEGGVTSFCGERYRGGIRLTAGENDTLIVTNFVALEDYIKGVVPYEMSADWPLEALRAQAVCARTYVVYNQNKYEEYDFDLTGDTESQVYRGMRYATEETDRAVESTEGQYVRYRGEVCEIYYFAADGGVTEDGKNVFGAERAYLTAKTDPFEDAVDYIGRTWTVWRDGEELSRRLRANEVEIGVVTDYEPVYSEFGNVIAGVYTDEKGNKVTLTERDSYAFIGMSNCRFRVEREDGLFVFSGSGWGHNCGMSQWGARAMAEVYGYDCDDIIRFYYTGAYVG